MEQEKIARAFLQEHVSLWGSCPYSRLEPYLLSCRNRSRIPPRAQTVLCALFPYRTPVGKHNISRYAIPPDYHDIVLPMLQKVVIRLEKEFPGNTFVAFSDNSPIPEVRAACLSGLGCVGDHGLLIHPEYGSWVFIGEVVTDLSLPCRPRELMGCLHCGVCVKRCPGKALEAGRLEKNRCLSHITKKKGELSKEEQELLLRGKLVWGCDLCQEVCPLNKNVKSTGMKQFQEDTIPVIEPGQSAFLQGRAFQWRPAAVIERNLEWMKEKEKTEENGV